MGNCEACCLTTAIERFSDAVIRRNEDDTPICKFFFLLIKGPPIIPRTINEFDPWLDTLQFGNDDDKFIYLLSKEIEKFVPREKWGEKIYVKGLIDELKDTCFIIVLAWPVIRNESPLEVDRMICRRWW